MKGICLKKAEWVYIPVYTVALLMALITFIFFGLLFAGVIRNGDAVSDELCNPFIYINYAAFW